MRCFHSLPSARQVCTTTITCWHPYPHPSHTAGRHVDHVAARRTGRQHFSWRKQNRSVFVASTNGGNDASDPVPGLLAAALLAGGLLMLGREPIEDWLFEQSIRSPSVWGNLGPGDLLGGLLWSTSLWYCSPLQLLLVFMGRVDAERPSDKVLAFLGRALNLPIDKPSAKVSPVLLLLAGLLFASAGMGVAAVLKAGLGDATWSVSTGLGTCIAAGVYEVGRPRRMSATEAEQLDAQWRDFVSFARARLQRGGRCHESEVFTSFRRLWPKYRSVDVLPDDVLRDMVRQYFRGVDRTPNGYYKNISLTAKVDAFTGLTTGSVISAANPGAIISAEQLLQEGDTTVTSDALPPIAADASLPSKNE